MLECALLLYTLSLLLLLIQILEGNSGILKTKKETCLFEVALYKCCSCYKFDYILGCTLERLQGLFFTYIFVISLNNITIVLTYLVLLVVKDGCYQGKTLLARN